MTLWIKQRGLCWICGRPMNRFGASDDPLGPSRDHLLPRSRGGRSATCNYLLAHRKCNSNRGAPKLMMTRAEVQPFKQVALERLKSSPHWVEDYRDDGRYRGTRRGLGTALAEKMPVGE